MVYNIEHLWLFLIILLVVAFLYASVGHGGASGYLALMALFSFAPETMRPTALLLNIFVAGIAFYHYYKAGYFNKKLFLTFAIASIPMSFFGGLLEADPLIYKRILGVCYIGNIDSVAFKKKVKSHELNSIMVKSGNAVAYRKYSDAYIKDEEYAMINKRGIWVGKFEMPWDWRKKN